MKIKIVPRIISNKNKNLAILAYTEISKQEFIELIDKWKEPYGKVSFGIDNTPYGMLCWALFVLHTDRKLKEKNNDLFFDLIFNVSKEENRDFVQKWFDILCQQNELNLYVQHERYLHRYRLMNKFEVQKWCKLMNDWMIYSQTNSISYIQATKWLHRNRLNKLKKEITSKLSHKDKDDIPINKFDKLSSLIQNYIKNEAPPTIVCDTTHLVENHFLQTKKLEFPIARVEDNIIWREFKINTSSQIVLLAKFVQKIPAYAYLLNGDRWDKILDDSDEVNQKLYTITVSSLCNIPSQEAFDNCTKVLTEAVINREFSIHQPTSIIVNKNGLEEIIFYPQDNSGLLCLVKIVVAYFDDNPNNCLVVVGKIDGKQRSVEIIGDYTDFDPEVKILKFLATIAYRDLLVARKVLRKPNITPTSGTGFGKSSRVNRHRIQYVSRIKYDRDFDNKFGNPDNVSKAIASISPHLRQCHKRKLAPGYQASEKAKQLAEEYDYLLPSGYTFVTPTQVGESHTLRKEFKSISFLDLMFS
ncbi:hypothetical protein [Calothrix sp. CCY 0018]|uniref:hypothetical protein n=1 Tax=Calothrix sp. CCY 0018 TaxID=3103864 RepID=UPI0039C5FD3F